jgi:hypothetical protein
MTDTAELMPVAWRYRDAWGRWAYCEAIDNINGPTVITEKQALYSADALSSLVRERDELAERVDRMYGAEELLTAQNIIVRAVWDVLGGEDATRADGQNLIARVREITARATAAEADAAKMREALKPFAKVGEVFSWAIGPDGIDDDLTVIIEPVARREWAQHLSTVNFTNARASLSSTSEGGKGE